MEDVQRYLLQKIQITHLPRLREIDIALKEHPETGSARQQLLEQRTVLVEKAKMLKQAAQECDHFRCDPWKFESHLFDDIVEERSKSQPDQQHLNHVRGLMRAGSVFSFDRLSNGQEPPQVKTSEQALPLVSRARLVMAEYWDWRIHVAGPFRHDPEAQQEYEQFKEEALHELDLVEEAIQRNALGDELEQATRIIEDLHEKIFSLHEKSTDKTHWRDLYIQLRPLRNFLYYRRLYPIQAKASLVTWKPRTAIGAKPKL